MSLLNDPVLLWTSAADGMKRPLTRSSESQRNRTARNLVRRAAYYYASIAGVSDRILDEFAPGRKSATEARRLQAPDWLDAVLASLSTETLP